jgi:hypothetical protein
MKDLFRLTTLFVVAILGTGLSLAGPISTFTFTGDCTIDCVGQGTGTLVLQDYTLGDALQTSNFVSFTYNSTVLDFEATSLNSLSGALPVDLPGPADVEMRELVPTLCRTISTCPTYDFESSLPAGGDQWQIGVDDQGINATWNGPHGTAVPEPSPFGMLAIVLAALGAWNCAVACRVSTKKQTPVRSRLQGSGWSLDYALCWPASVRRNHACANRRSWRTECTERPVTSAASSAVKPPKYRISIAWARTGFSAASWSRARSSSSSGRKSRCRFPTPIRPPRRDEVRRLFSRTFWSARNPPVSASSSGMQSPESELCRQHLARLRRTF